MDTWERCGKARAVAKRVGVGEQYRGALLGSAVGNNAGGRCWEALWDCDVLVSAVLWGTMLGSAIRKRNLWKQCSVIGSAVGERTKTKDGTQ